MKKCSVIVIVALGIFLVLGASKASAEVYSTCVYKLYYMPATSWVELFPGDTPTYDANTLWKYSYTLYNTGSTGDGTINWWHVYLYMSPNPNYASNVNQTGIPEGWDADGVTPPDEPGLTTGIFGNKVQWASDDISTYEILPGNSLDGFEYTFNWSNLQNPPGSQHYQAGDGGSQSGDTTPVPEPNAMLLLGIGLVGLAGEVVSRRRFKA